MNNIVSFEKTTHGVKETKKIRRVDIPGRIEMEEILRADMIEYEADVRCRADKNSWYNQKVL